MNRRTSLIVRATGAIGATVALVGGVTYAQLTTNTVTLSNNTISTTSPNTLQISKNNTTFKTQVAGFDFTGLVPNMKSTSSSETFYLKNTGGSDINLYMFIPTLPTFTVTPSGTVDNTKVKMSLTCSSISGPITTPTTGNDLTSLNTPPGATLTGTLNAGDTATCSLNVTMAAGAVSNTSATSVSSTGFDVQFGGTTAT